MRRGKKPDRAKNSSTGGRSGPAGRGRGRQRSAVRPKPIAGVVVRRGKHLEVEPLFQSGSPFLIAREGSLRVQPDEVVLVTYAHGRRVRVTKRLGSRRSLEDVVEALLLDTVLERGFSPAVLEAAQEVAELETEPDRERVDLRDLFTFTVDPATARDFDDALSFEGSETGVRVYVHIADVAYYVAEGSPVDQEALLRANSVYVPTGVEPMLPPILSAGVCSLQPGVDRKAVTVEMELTERGEVHSVRFYRSVIRSDERLNYDELEEIFRGERRPGELLGAALDLGRPLAGVLRENRFARGSLRISSVEPEFHWQDGRVVAAHPAEELESHAFIEDFMILANEQVASFLEQERIPAVYRVHDLPDPFHLGRLLDLFAELDVPTPPFDALTATPNQIRRVMREVAEMVERFSPRTKGKAALRQQVLRAQSRAVYSTSNIGHFGLALGTYAHFTSPIRRYPDLLVHRALLYRLGLEPRPASSTLPEWAEHCSVREREAAKVELKADDIALAFLLQRRLEEEGWDQEFEGQIVGLVRSGAFLLFDRLYEGFLPARELPDDYYELNETESALIGRRTGKAYRLADVVPIKVSEIDEARGRVDLVPAGT
ncbi:MAG: ribonuclease R [Thermoleophilia bacterium]